MKETPSKVKTSNSSNYFLLFVILCLVIIATTFLFYYYFINKINLSESSQIGDSYGALSSLFTGLAFAGVIISILLQQEELRETRKELKNSADAQDKTQKALNEQLALMNANHKITLLDNYISNVIKGSADSSEAYIKEVIRTETFNVLSLPEYEKIFKPNISEFNTFRETRPPDSTKFNFHFQITNKGCDLDNLTFINLNKIPGLSILDNKTHIKKNEGLRFEIEYDQNMEYEFEVKYKCSYIPKWYSQKITMRITNRILNISFSGPSSLISQ